MYASNSKRKSIPKLVKLDDDKRQELMKQAKDELQAMTQDRQDWVSRFESYFAQWDDYVSPIRKGPFESSSNVHVPFTMQKALEFHARFYNALFDVSPWFYLIPGDIADFQKKELNERLMQWALESLSNRYQGIQPVMDKFIWEVITKGRSVLKLYWEEERENFIDVEPEMMEVMQPDGTVAQVPTGAEVEVEKEEVIYAGPCLKPVSLLDFYIPAGYTIDDAPVIQERLYLFPNDLRWLKKYDHFYKDAIDDLLKHPGTPLKHSEVDRGIAQTRDELEGMASVDAEVNQDAYRVIERYGRFDVNGDGFEEKVVCWFSEDYDIFLGWNFTNRCHKSGRPPYYMTSFIPRESADLGLVELLYPVNQEIDAAHNMLIDSGVIQNMPWFTVKESRSVKADDIVLQPGKGIPVDNHDDIQFRNQPNPMGHFIQVEQMAAAHGERLTLSDLGHGMVPGKVGPLGTASGSMALMQQMNAKMNVHISRLRKTWNEILRGIFQLLKENLPVGHVFRVTGEDGREVFGRIESRQDFCSSVDFKFVAPSAVLNKELDKQNSIFWLQTAMNPLLVQLGLSSPDTIKAALKDVARCLGKLSTSVYIADPQTVPRPQSLEEEISFLIQGITPVIVLNDDHESKVKGLVEHMEAPVMEQLQEKNPQMYSYLVAGFKKAIQMHMQMFEALKRQAPAQQISAQGMAPEIGQKMAGGPNPAESPEGEPAPLGSGAGAGSPGRSGGEE